MEVCDECKEIEICSCENFCIAPDGGLTAGEDYILTLTDKFGKKYTQEITVNVYGTLCVDITGFPDAFFNPYAGRLTVTLALASDPDTDIQVVYGSLNYTCISLVVKDCPNSTSDIVIPPDPDCECVTQEMLDGFVESVTGNIVDNTDPQNPIVTGLASGDNVSELANDAGYLESVVAGNAITVDNTDPLNPIVNALTPPIQNGLISGGRVTWIANYDYEVSAAVYVIDGVLYTSPVTPLTLTPSDPALDRLDTFILTNAGTATFLTGTPAADPLEPDIDVTTQLRIAFALVTAASVAPTLPTEDIYLENTEWVTAVSAATWNPASGSNPFAGAVDIEGTAVANNQFITFTPALFPSLLLLDSLVFKIRSKAAWSNPSRLVFQFQNGTTIIGNAVQIGGNANPYGFISSVVGSYQNINIPLADFGNIAAATRLRIIKTGSGTIGFYLDNIQMVGNNNVVVIPSTPLYKVYTGLLNQRAQDSGVLTVGVEYTITAYQAGDDFINVGAIANVTGEVFVATGTTPTNWTTGSLLTNNQPPSITIEENTLGNIVWTRLSGGLYVATLSNAFTEVKTWHCISKTEFVCQMASYWVDASSIYFQTAVPVLGVAAPGEQLQYLSQDGFLYNTPIEIRVYP